MASVPANFAAALVVNQAARATVVPLLNVVMRASAKICAFATRYGIFDCRRNLSLATAGALLGWDLTKLFDEAISAKIVLNAVCLGQNANRVRRYEQSFALVVVDLIALAKFKAGELMSEETVDCIIPNFGICYFDHAIRRNIADFNPDGTVPEELASVDRDVGFCNAQEKNQEIPNLH
jgi:hypothetical protein